MSKNELVETLRELSAKGFLPIRYSGPSGLTRSIRHDLGISGQGSLIHGHRVFSSRDDQGRMTLLASVPNWRTSPIGSTRNLLEFFGYGEGTDRRLNVTVTFGEPNSRGLSLLLSEDNRLLYSVSTQAKFPIVAEWDLDILATKLKKKFNSAAALEMQFKKSGSLVFYKVVGIKFLSEPKIENIASLIKRGSLTVDHVIENKSGAPVEHGPLFRVAKTDLHLLFTGRESVIFPS